ncbi:MAG: hypothetical protein WAK97_09060, partial [Pseudolabrys sp.]
VFASGKRLVFPNDMAQLHTGYRRVKQEDCVLKPSSEALPQRAANVSEWNGPAVLPLVARFGAAISGSLAKCGR